MTNEIQREMKGILDEVKSELPDTPEVKLAKKKYFDLPMVVAKLRDLNDALGGLPESPNKRDAINDLTKALGLLDKSGEALRLLGLQKA